MRRVGFLASWLALVPLAALAAPHASPREELLVSCAWLAQHLSDPNLVLLHVGEKSEYDAAHIPGARYASLKELSSEGTGTPPLTLEMSPPERLRAQIAALGVSDDSRVVVYYGNDWVSPSTRVVLTLRYAGLSRVSLLDGGMGAWMDAGQPVTDVVPPARTGTVSPIHPGALLVDAAFVEAHLKTPGFAVVDARDAAFYDGEKAGGPRDHRTQGHIAGALSVPFSEVTTSDLKLKPADQLAALFEKAGVKPGDTVIAYCHIGQQATATLFAAETLGHPVRLYDGSFEDWARRGLPVENPGAHEPE
jgi:thiosulfate/3-mercaptopyruvate sulfurtransferase